MRRRLPLLRVPFGFIFTRLTWAARFAIDEDDVSLQVHPLEEVRRAAALLRGSRPDECFHELRDHVGVEIALQHPGGAMAVRRRKIMAVTAVREISRALPANFRPEC
jgi:hypothetical protein